MTELDDVVDACHTNTHSRHLRITFHASEDSAKQKAFEAQTKAATFAYGKLP